MKKFAKKLTLKNCIAALLPGEEGEIIGFSVDNEGVARIREMGMHEGTMVRLVRYAPLGDPIEVKMRGFHLSIRQELAKQVMIRLKQ